MPHHAVPTTDAATALVEKLSLLAAHGAEAEIESDALTASIKKALEQAPSVAARADVVQRVVSVFQDASHSRVRGLGVCPSRSALVLSSCFVTVRCWL